MTMHVEFVKLINEQKEFNCGCGSCGNCGDLSIRIEEFCELNQLNYVDDDGVGGIPCVYEWKDGSITETVAYGPGDVRIKDEMEGAR